MADSTNETNQEGQEVPEGNETDDDILKEARDRYKESTDNDSDNIAAARDDLLFLTGGLNQWDTESARIRTAERRPCLTVNNLPTFLHQVTNQQRENKPAVKVHPVDDNADMETAEVLQGLIRHIEYDSNASVAYDRAVNSAAAIGIGWLRLVTEYESDDSFDQKIMYKSIRNALSVHPDRMMQEPDGSDMQYCFIDSLMNRAAFKREFPNAEANNTNLIGQEIYRGWFTENTVLVTEYYRIKKTPAMLCELSDGSKVWKDELPETLPEGVTVAMDAKGKPKERMSARSTVQWFKLTGSDVLERTEIKCKWIPVFPVYGDEVDVDGRVYRSGIIRNAKDPFRMYNLWITLATEEVTMRPKTPFIGAVGQFETAKAQWNVANQRSFGYIEYDMVTVDGTAAPPPARQPMADIPAGMLAMAMHAADNKKATTGLFDASFGAKGTATSGIQEREQQAQGDLANFHYTDNLNLTVRHIGRCEVNMIPNYYDAARTIRILGEDDTAKQAKINQPTEEINPKTKAVEIVMHDMTVGTYDITVSAGPSYSTRRQEAAEFMTNAMQAAKDPVTNQVLTYLAVKNQDLAGADEATKMLKKMLPSGIVESDDDEPEEVMVQTPQGPVPASQAGQVIEQMGMALQNADKALEKADLDKIENGKAEVAIKAKAEETRAFEAETKRRQQEVDAKAEAAKLEIQLIEAKAGAMEATEKAIRAACESEQQAHERIPVPTREDILALVDEHRPPAPKTMMIKAPSGVDYQVTVQ